MDDYSRHEVLHVVSVVLEMIETHVMKHEYTQTDRHLSHMIENVEDNLFDIYQYIAEQHLC